MYRSTGRCSASRGKPGKNLGELGSIHAIGARPKNEL